MANGRRLSQPDDEPSPHLAEEAGLEARELALVDGLTIQEIGERVEAVHDMTVTSSGLAGRTGRPGLTQPQEHGGPSRAL